jgi:hypothetical protein
LTAQLQFTTPIDEDLRAHDFDRAREVFSHSEYPIDALHQQFKDLCRAERTKLELLIDPATGSTSGG